MAPPAPNPPRGSDHKPAQKGGKGWIPPMPPAPAPTPPEDRTSVAMATQPVPQMIVKPQMGPSFTHEGGQKAVQNEGLGQLAISQVQAMLQPWIQQQLGKALMDINPPAPAAPTNQQPCVESAKKRRVQSDSSSDDDSREQRRRRRKKARREEKEKTMWIHIEDKCFKARYTD